MKLVLQIAAGVLLGATLIGSGIYGYTWYRIRSRADKYEWEAAQDFMDTLVRVCPGISPPTRCAEEAVNACRDFHINEADCAKLVHEAAERLRRGDKPSNPGR